MTHEPPWSVKEASAYLGSYPMRAYVVNGGGVPAKGRFDRASGDVPWYVQGVLDFFGKQTVDFVSPNQPPGG